MKKMRPSSVTLTVTSPPYDNLRDYKGYELDFAGIAKGLYRITKPGGVVVWVVGDKIVKGSRTLTSFRQALYFREIGFNIHDVMIYQKKNTPFMRSNAYTNCYEFMLILTKGAPATFNPITTGTARNGFEMIVITRNRTHQQQSAERIKKERPRRTFGSMPSASAAQPTTARHSSTPPSSPNAWLVTISFRGRKPATWCLTRCVGSGTTCKMAKTLGRNFVGVDISGEYVELARKRINRHGAFVPVRQL